MQTMDGGSMPTLSESGRMATRGVPGVGQARVNGLGR